MKTTKTSDAALEAVALYHAERARRAYGRGHYDEYSRRIKIIDGLRAQMEG